MNREDAKTRSALTETPGLTRGLYNLAEYSYGPRLSPGLRYFFCSDKKVGG